MNANRRYCGNEVNAVTKLDRKAKAVILYDDSAVLPAAERFLARMESDGGRRTEWRVNSWRFDMLKLRQRLEAYRAIEESMDAELVVVAVHDPASWGGLPVAWLGLWWDYRRSQAARLMVTPFDQFKERQFAPQTGAQGRMAEAWESPFSVLCRIGPDEDAQEEFQNRNSGG